MTCCRLLTSTCCSGVPLCRPRPNSVDALPPPLSRHGNLTNWYALAAKTDSIPPAVTGPTHGR